MLKMCGESILKPLEYIFRASLNDEMMLSVKMEKGESKKKMINKS